MIRWHLVCIAGVFTLADCSAPPSSVDTEERELAATSAGESDAQNPDTTEIACSILVDFIETEFTEADKPLFLSTESASRISVNEAENLDELAEYMHGNSETGASLKQIRQLLEEERRLSKINPVATCSAIAAIKEQRSHIPQHDPSEIPKTTPDGLFYEYDTLAVSMPLVDLIRNEASFEASRTCGPLCGSGVSVLYKRNDDGEWVKDSETGIWIS